MKTLMMGMVLVSSVAARPDDGATIFAAAPVERGALLVETGDMDEDGHLDLVLTRRGPGFPLNYELAVLLGVGDGTFVEGTVIPNGIDPISGMRVADLDGDGHLDVTARRVGVLLGKGDGSFEEPLPFLEFPADVSLGGSNRLDLLDLDADGVPDAAVFVFLPTGQHRLVTVLGNGDGTFGREQCTFLNSQSVGQFAFADLDEDGWVDFTDLRLTPGFGSPQQGTLLVARGDGSGGFGIFERTLSDQVYAPVLLADVDADGHLDVVGAGPFDGFTLSVGRGDGSFEPSVFLGGDGVVFDQIQPYRAFAVADVDGDGDVDVLTSTRTGTAVGEGAGAGLGVFLARGTGAFDPLETFGGFREFSNTGLMADVDGDGLDDAVVWSPGSLGINLMVMLARTSRFVAFGDGHAPAGSAPPTLTGSGSPVPEGLVSFRIETAEPGAPGLLFLAYDAVPQPLAGGVLVPSFGGLWPGQSAVVPVVAPWDATDRWPADLYPGAPLYLQAFFAGSGGSSSTNTLIVVGE